jgi:hypothetical protein
MLRNLILGDLSDAGGIELFWVGGESGFMRSRFHFFPTNGRWKTTLHRIDGLIILVVVVDVCRAA